MAAGARRHSRTSNRGGEELVAASLGTASNIQLGTAATAFRRTVPKVVRQPDKGRRPARQQGPSSTSQAARPDEDIIDTDRLDKTTSTSTTRSGHGLPWLLRSRRGQDAAGRAGISQVPARRGSPRIVAARRGEKVSMDELVTTRRRRSHPDDAGGSSSPIPQFAQRRTRSQKVEAGLPAPGRRVCPRPRAPSLRSSPTDHRARMRSSRHRTRICCSASRHRLPGVGESCSGHHRHRRQDTISRLWHAVPPVPRSAVWLGLLQAYRADHRAGCRGLDWSASDRPTLPGPLAPITSPSATR